MKDPVTLSPCKVCGGEKFSHHDVLWSDLIAQWGLSSRDGRCITKREFTKNIARYQLEFGLWHLAFGKLKTANRSLLQAWLKHPVNLKTLAYVPAGLLGWRPKW